MDASSRRERLALRVMQAGAILVIPAAFTYREFELDRFFVPKELVLHVTAVLAALLLVRAFRRVHTTRVDLLLLAYLALGVISGVLAANGWLATRALTITASGVALFWAARTLRAAGFADRLLNAAAFAVVFGTATSLAQTYGVEIDLFSINRAPGGTLGNRNFIAHLAAFGLPVVLFTALRPGSFVRYALASAGVMLVIATLVLTRSRAGWLALGAALVVFLAAVLISRALRSDGRTWLRLAGILLLAGGGVAAAILVPNSLNWRSDNPYLDSIRGVANYQEGSGRGRLIQYRQSLRMAAGSPLLGVGPGNWAVEYPEHAVARDPSLDGNEAGMTSNPWPSSDWVAFTSERGFAAMILLALVFAMIALSALRRLRRALLPADALSSATLLATIAATLVAGAFDAVLLLALPALLVWTVLGALWTPDSAQLSNAEPQGSAAPPDPAHSSTPLAAHGPVHSSPPPDVDDITFISPPPSSGRSFHAWRQPALIAVMLVSLLGAVRSAAQLTAMGIYSAREDNTWLRRAAFIDPGNYRLRLRLARNAGNREQRCEHALVARDLYPTAGAARSAARGCD